jgi:hypothetical protein
MVQRSFQIRIIYPIVFRDQSGNALRTINAGEVLEATADTGHYYVTSIGGIYYDEAEIVNEQ